MGYIFRSKTISVGRLIREGAGLSENVQPCGVDVLNNGFAVVGYLEPIQNPKERDECAIIRGGFVWVDRNKDRKAGLSVCRGRQYQIDDFEYECMDCGVTTPGYGAHERHDAKCS